MNQYAPLTNIADPTELTTAPATEVWYYTIDKFSRRPNQTDLTGVVAVSRCCGFCCGGNIVRSLLMFLVLAGVVGVVYGQLDLSGIDLSGADLTGANLRGANLTGADLTGADLSGAILSGVDLTDVVLTDQAMLGDGVDNRDVYVEDVSGPYPTAQYLSERMKLCVESGAFIEDLYGANLSGQDLSGAGLSL